MNDLNSILMEGNLTRDPVLSTTPTGTPVCNFSVGSHHLYKKDDEQRKDTSFFDVEVWAKMGENCAEYLRKGRGVRVVGRLKQDRWKDGEGRPRSRVKIVAEHVEFRPMKKKALENPEDVETDSDESTEALGAPSIGDAQTIPSVEGLRYHEDQTISKNARPGRITVL
ncbi:MAG: single-stranded DNA-binding protein [Spirochaeta sp.]|jgi:single-strand DNA-binding protein|nr:single-stranded DNA-binding protein [Spirochaeta sp.]